MKSKRIYVATSPLTNSIHAGYVNADGRTWSAGKQDVTGAACNAVAEHVVANGQPVIVSCNGVPIYEISVRKLGE